MKFATEPTFERQGLLSFAIRTRNDPEATIPEISRVVHPVDSAVSIDTVVPISRLVSNSIVQQRFPAVLMGLFAIVANNALDR